MPEAVVADLGTGDGKAVLARAARQPHALVLGIDASAAAMADASRRVARPARKGGLANAVFVLAAAESPPDELRGAVDELTVQFPWGSLLRGALALNREAAAGIAALMAPGGRAVVLVAGTERDRLEDVPTARGLLDGGAAELRDRWEALGLELVELRPADAAEIEASGSSWARRLLTRDADRLVARLVLRRPA